MNPDQLAELLGVAAAVPRLDGAACRGNPEPHDVDVRASREAIDSAIEICLACPAMLACGVWLDSLPPDQQPRGVVGGRLLDPDAPRTAREVMGAELAARQPKPQRQPKPSGGPRRLRERLLSAVDHAGPEGLTAREAAVALCGADPTGTSVELVRQGLSRAVASGWLRRIGGGGRGVPARYVRAGAVASPAATDAALGCADTREAAAAS